MVGSTASIPDDEATSHLFDARFGPSPRPGEWTLRVRPLDQWTDEQGARWGSLIQDGFVHLAAIGGLCGERGSPLSPAFGGNVEVWEVDDWIEWRFGPLAIDPASASLLLNLCDWSTFHIAPVTDVEVLADGLSPGPEPPDRALPGRSARLGFALDEQGQTAEGISIEIEFTQPISSGQKARIAHLLKPWHTALLRWGFAPFTLPTGMSDVRPARTPITVVDDLWSETFEVFTARYEAIDVLLNCVERIHQSVCPVRVVAIE